MWITCRKFSKDCENTHFKKLAGIKQNLPFRAGEKRENLTAEAENGIFYRDILRLDKGDGSVNEK